MQLTGKVINTKTNGGHWALIGGYLMISIEWIDAPASTGGNVIGHTQELQVTDFLRDYKVLRKSVTCGS